ERHDCVSDCEPIGGVIRTHRLSFPRSAWERSPRRSASRTRPDGTQSIPAVRSHAPRGNEERVFRISSFGFWISNMNPLPAQDLRSNQRTWAVPPRLTPAVVSVMRGSMPPEPHDPDFYGQELETTYFDTVDFDLRKARRRGDTYLTLRLR